MNVEFENIPEKDLIMKELDKIAVEEVYCTKETCNHVTHPASRMEVSGKQIDSILKKLSLEKKYGVEFKNEGVTCNDYFVIYSF